LQLETACGSYVFVLSYTFSLGLSPALISLVLQAALNQVCSHQTPAIPLVLQATNSIANEAQCFTTDRPDVPEPRHPVREFDVLNFCSVFDSQIPVRKIAEGGSHVIAASARSHHTQACLALQQFQPPYFSATFFSTHRNL